jgi:hypothetical protein
LTRGGGTRLRPGDVLSIEADDRKWYLCYVGRHDTLGDTVWVTPDSQPREAVLSCQDLLGDGYWAFYPATAALRRKMISRAGYCPESMRAMPRLFRYGSPFVRKGEPAIWRIAESARVGVPFVIRESLTAEEAAIPQAAIWNHEFLLDKLRSRWHPRHEASGRPPDAV